MSELKSARRFKVQSLLSTLFRHEQTVYAQGKPIGCLHGGSSGRGSTLPMASPGKTI